MGIDESFLLRYSIFRKIISTGYERISAVEAKSFVDRIPKEGLREYESRDACRVASELLYHLACWGRNESEKEPDDFTIGALASDSSLAFA